MNVTNALGRTLKFKSSNSKVVAINNKGVMSFKGVGRATITITASANGNYNSDVRKVIVTVYPKKVTQKVSSTKGVAKVVVSKVNKTTKYQVQYSLNSNFKNAKTATGKGNTVSIKNLKSGKKYYIRSRVYLFGKYSVWSSKKAITIK